MKKIYNLLALVLLTFASATVSQAQKYYVADPSSGDNVQEIEEGVDYAIMSARYAESYLCGDVIANAINDECLYQFEKAGENADGDMTWRVKRSIDNKYILAPDNRLEGQAEVSYTSMQDMAFICQIRKPRYFTAIPEEGDEKYDEFYQDYFITISAGGENSWIIIEENNGYSFLSLWSGDGAAHIWNYCDTNALRIVKVKEAENAQLVSLCMADLCPNGVAGYVAGDGLGQCSQEALDEATAAYAVCEELVNTNSKDTEACNAAVNRLKAAMAAVEASIKNLTEGYYYMVNLGRTGGNGGAVPYNVEANSTTLWNYYSNLIPETPTGESVPYIWQLIQEGDVWYIKNVVTGKYIGSASGLSTALPVTDTPFGYNIKAATNLTSGSGEPYAGYFNIQNPDNGTYCLHAAASGQAVVYWGPASGTGNHASAWTFVEVDEASLNAGLEAYKLIKVQQDIENLIGEASLSYNSTKSYLSDATADDNFTDEPGILQFEQTDPADASTANVTSNATETSEGSIEELFDGDFTTYFHSMWSATPDPNGYHYLQIDLGAEYQQLVMKYAKRHNNEYGSPTVVTIQGADNVDGPYVDEVTIKTPYSFPVTIAEGNVKEDWGGMAGFEMGAAHRYIRIVVKETSGMGLTSGYPYFYWSELRLYEGRGLDEENSMLTVIDKDIVQTLLNEISNSKAALNNGTASQATLDALQAAYDKFLEFYPDPTKITTLLTEANELIEGGKEGEGLGLYAAGSIAELQAAVDEVTPKVRDVMTLEEVNACVARMSAALAAFKATLQLPEEDKVFFIQSTSDNEVNKGHRLYAANNGLTTILHGGFVKGENDDVATYDNDINNRLNYMWKLIKNEDGTFAIRNIGTGYYISAGYTSRSSAVLQTDEPAAITLRAAPQTPGSFNLVLSTGIYANAQPSSALENDGSLVTWNVAGKADNSAFTFEEVGEMPFASYIDIAQGAQIITLPYECSPIDPVYTVIGINEENEIQFAEFTEGNIPAGTPFLLVNEDENMPTTPFMLNAATFDDIAYDFEPKSVNGLTGTLQSRTIEVSGIGVLSNNRVVVTDSKVVVAANSGFFDNHLPATTEEGDYSLSVVGGQIVSDGSATGINGINLTDNKARMDVYTISGLKVRSNVSGSEATRNLPAGIYIVGGKKVLVK